jgi:hypothetical protein
MSLSDARFQSILKRGIKIKNVDGNYRKLPLKKTRGSPFF